MADILENKIEINGTYGDEATPVTFSSNTVTTTIVRGLTVTKSADKQSWVDGLLTYTITINNSSGAKLASGTVMDQLNTTLVNFNTESGVTINGEATSNYTYSGGVLSVTLPEIADSSTTTIVFKVSLV